MLMSAVTAVSRWFSTKRSLATGLAVSGAGFGVFGFSPLIRFLIDKWGRQEALLIEGALAFNGILFALLLRPVPPKRVPNDLFPPEIQDFTVGIKSGSSAAQEELKPLHQKSVNY